jgi:hypothetical protein
MLKRSWGAIILVLGSVIWILAYSSSFRYCAAHPDQYEDKEALQERVGDFPFAARIQKCVSVFLHENNEAFVLLATVAIAGFTGTLWRSTKLLTTIATDQNTLTETTQRAYLSAGIGGIHALTNKSGYVAHIKICNVGRLPARKVEWAIERPHFDSNGEWDPPEPIEFLSGSNVIPPGTIMTQGSERFTVSDAQIGKDIFLYVWGRVKYRDGLTPNLRTTKFCHRYPLSVFRGDVEGSGQCVLPVKNGRYNRYYNDAN